MKRKIEYVQSDKYIDSQFVEVNGSIYPIVTIDEKDVCFKSGFDKETTVYYEDISVLGLKLLKMNPPPKFEVVGQVVASDKDDLLIRIDKSWNECLRLGDELKLTVEILYEPIPKAY